MSQLDFKRECWAKAFVGSCLVVSAQLVCAQPGVQGVGASAIRGFSVVGANPLNEPDVSLSLAPFLRQPATLDNLQKASSALETLLRDKGFGLHRVVLPPQEVGEVIQLQVVKFSVGQVGVDGASAFDEANIRRSLPSLVPGGTPNLETLAIQTAMANENPSKNVQVALRAASEPDLIDATVKVRDSSPAKLSASLNNTGTRQTGRDRFTLAGGHDNVMGLDHQFLAAVTTSLANPSRVRQVGLNYRVPIYDALTMLDFQVTDSNVVGDFGSFSSTGAGRSLGFTVTRYLHAKPGLKRYAFLSLEDKTFEPTAFNGVSLVGQQTRRSRPVSLGYALKAQNSAHAWEASVALAINLPGGSGNSLAAYQTESLAVTQARWTALRAHANWSQGFGDGWAVALRGQAQWAPTALIAGEQIGIGGHASLRGTQERALAGDSGLAGSIEITSPEWQPGLRWVAFWDAGWIDNRIPAGSVLPSSDQTVAVGLGLRYTRGPVSAVLDYGRVIKGSNTALAVNSVAPKSGDHKLHLMLSMRY